MGNVNMEASQINYRGGSKKMSVEEAIKAAGTEITPEEKEWIDTIPKLASQEIIAPEFDAEEGVYAVGDLVIYQGGLYQFTTAHETAGAWNAEEVAAVKVSDEIDSLKSGLINAESKIVYDDDSASVGNVEVGEIKYLRITLVAKAGYTLASANGRLNYADSAVVSCQITDDTTLDVYVRNIKSFTLENQTLYYRLIYVKTSV